MHLAQIIVITRSSSISNAQVLTEIFKTKNNQFLNKKRNRLKKTYRQHTDANLGPCCRPKCHLAACLKTMCFSMTLILYDDISEALIDLTNV